MVLGEYAVLLMVIFLESLDFNVLKEMNVCVCKIHHN